MRRTWVWASVIGGLLVSLGAAGYAMWPRDPEPELVFAPLVAGRIFDGVPAVGTVRATKTVEVGSEVSGRLVEVTVEVNDRVKSGQVLARFDPAPLAEAVDLAEARLADALGAAAAADTDVELARARHGRLSAIAKQGFSPEARLEEERANLERAEIARSRAAARRKEAEQNLAQARRELALGVIRSPIDGFVLERKVAAGQVLNAALNAPVLFNIASDLQQVEVDALIAEADVARVAAGMEANVRVDAYPNQKFSGRVVRLGRSARLEGRSVTYPAVIAVNDESERLLPGMTANVEIVNQQADNVLILPIEALHLAYFGERKTALSEEAVEAIEQEFGESEAAIHGAEFGRYARHGLQRLIVKRKDGLYVAPVRPGKQDQRFFEVIIPEEKILPREVQLKPGDQVLVRVGERRG